MKQSFSFVLTLIFLGFPLAAQAQWRGPIEGSPRGALSLCFLDSLKGFSAGQASPAGTSATIGRTTDGGETWQYMEAPAGASPRRIRFGTRDLGIGVGGGGTIIRTTDGGASWESRPSGTTNDLFDLTIAPDGTVWACGMDIILKSADNGATWTGQTDLPGGFNPLWGISFRTAQDGWAVGLYGRCLRTTDEGHTWNEYASPIQGASHFGVQWLTPSRGVMISPWPIVLSTDGGATWQSTYNCEGISVYDLAFADTLHGWIVGQSGTILRTSDGGGTWARQSSPEPTDYLEAVACVSPTRAWIAGDGGVYKTTNGGLAGVQNAGLTLPPRFLLAQNFPNPFNPTTTMRYSLPHRSHVLLTVFNTLGQQVAELVDGEMEAGSYIVQFNGRNLASGVYFYRLQAGTFMQVRRMLLAR